jgi:transcriptional regulator with XRE-family HTH domain
MGDMKAAGRLIQAARHRLRLTQQELATILGLTASHTSNIENGHIPVPSYVGTIIFMMERNPDVIPDLLERAIRRTVEKMQTRGARRYVGVPMLQTKIRKVAADIARGGE